jgi:hypothetical protein
MSTPLVITATALTTSVYYAIMERESYRSSWRVHLSGITLPIIALAILPAGCRHPVVVSILVAFAAIHVASVLDRQ